MPRPPIARAVGVWGRLCTRGTPFHPTRHHHPAPAAASPSVATGAYSHSGPRLSPEERRVTGRRRARTRAREGKCRSRCHR